VALAAAEAADIVLMPCRAGILDLRAIGTTARAIKVAGKPAKWQQGWPDEQKTQPGGDAEPSSGHRE
jgi:hypothetical protein